jgi:hypothetical protein
LEYVLLLGYCHKQVYFFMAPYLLSRAMILLSNIECRGRCFSCFKMLGVGYRGIGGSIGCVCEGFVSG